MGSPKVRTLMKVWPSSRSLWATLLKKCARSFPEIAWWNTTSGRHATPLAENRISGEELSGLCKRPGKGAHLAPQAKRSLKPTTDCAPKNQPAVQVLQRSLPRLLLLILRIKRSLPLLLLAPVLLILPLLLLLPALLLQKPIGGT